MSNTRVLLTPEQVANFIIKMSPKADGSDDVAMTRQAHRDIADKVKQLSDPRNLAEVMKPGTVGE